MDILGEIGSDISSDIGTSIGPDDLLPVEGEEDPDMRDLRLIEADEIEPAMGIVIAVEPIRKPRQPDKKMDVLREIGSDTSSDIGTSIGPDDLLPVEGEDDPDMRDLRRIEADEIEPGMGIVISVEPIRQEFDKNEWVLRAFVDPCPVGEERWRDKLFLNFRPTESTPYLCYNEYDLQQDAERSGHTKTKKANSMKRKQKFDKMALELKRANDDLALRKATPLCWPKTIVPTTKPTTVIGPYYYPRFQPTLDEKLKQAQSIDYSEDPDILEFRHFCFLDFSLTNGQYLGRIIIELYTEHVPLTTKNFLALCKGDHHLSYKGNLVHRIKSGEYMEMGDITKCNGKGGFSIYGKSFPMENHKLKHTKAGVLSMKRLGYTAENNSQFCITFKKMEQLDQKNVVFGNVVKGNDMLINKIQYFGRQDGKPLENIIISKCGQIKKKNK